MSIIRIGVLGAYRGTSMINYCQASLGKAKVVAICDKWQEAIETQKQNLNDDTITYYDNFEDFVKHDMDAVVLANYATEHAPFAIKCLKRGLHVFSEVLPCQTMKEAVELVEAIEETGLTYAYGENYCFMPAPYEMRKLYKEGKIGEFEYGEGEYVHNGEPIWPSITYGDESHWRNNIYSTYYCTHSLGPIIHITGLRPVSVMGIEGPLSERKIENGAKSGLFGMEFVKLENGGIIKSLHGSLYKNSIWYTLYGAKGRMETAREDTENDDFSRIYVNADEYAGEYPKENRISNYLPEGYADDRCKMFGHGGSDFYCMDQFVDRLLGKKDADIIDVYEALDMFLPGMFAYRSVMEGGKSLEIPNLRDKAEREKYRNDTACTDKNVAGDMLLPVYSKGTPDIPKKTYDRVREKWEAEKTTSDYFKTAMTQGNWKEKITNPNLK